jgi:hypothetical protein
MSVPRLVDVQEGPMASDELTTPRSRRALLAAAAGAVGALAANAAMPLTAAAVDGDAVTLGAPNDATQRTSITASGDDSNAFEGHATGTGVGYGLLGTSLDAGGIVGWSVSAPDASWFQPAFTAYTGVFGSAPAYIDSSNSATGVWGDSPDIGVLGTGGNGVVGYGYVGVEGDANSVAGSVGVWAWAPSTAQVALRVTGKVSFNRSGRKAMSSGSSSALVYLGGVTSTSKVFAVLATSESGRWVRAVVPAAGRFRIYLNTTLSSSAVVSWFVLD